MVYYHSAHSPPNTSHHGWDNNSSLRDWRWYSPISLANFIACLVPSLSASVPGLLLSHVHPHLRVNVLPVPLAWIPSSQVTSLGVVGVFLWCPLRMTFLSNSFSSAHSTFLLFITTHTFWSSLVETSSTSESMKSGLCFEWPSTQQACRMNEWVVQSGANHLEVSAVFKNLSSGARCQLPSLVPVSWALFRSVSLSKKCGY